MKTLKYTSLLALFAIVGVAQTVPDGPFGLYRGMTKEQAITLIGNAGIKTMGDDYFISRIVPKPHPDFDRYMLVFSTEGLVKIVAIGRSISTNGFGEGIINAFVETRNAISKTYRPPVKEFNFVQDGSLWWESRYFMMGLLKKDRRLSAYWGSPGLGFQNHISGIALKAFATSSEEGFLELNYEFDTLEEYSNKHTAKAAEVF
jgi:hypothetical protein